MPVLVVVMVTVLAPVSMVPRVMLTVDADTLLCRITDVEAVVLLTAKILNVVGPETFVV